MTERQLVKKVINDSRDDEHVFLIFFKSDCTYTVAPRKFLMCEDDKLLAGEEVLVKTGPNKRFMGHILNIGPRNQLEKLAAIHNKNANSPGVVATSSRRLEYEEDDDKPSAKKAKKSSKQKAVIAESSDSEGSDNENDIVMKEKEKLDALFTSINKGGEFPSLPRFGPSTSGLKTKSETCPCESRIRLLEKSVKELEGRIAHLTRSPTATPSSSKVKQESPTTPKNVQEEIPEKRIEYNGENLCNVPAPVKEPHKCALKLMDKLFSQAEMRNSILLATRRSSKTPLHQERVKLMFDVLHHKYGHDKIEKIKQAVVDCCNQKCRDAGRLTVRNQERQ